MKKSLLLIAVSMSILFTLPTMASAHGHCRSRSAYAASPSLCDVDGCYRAKNHMHNGTTYAGHYYGDGHDYHQVCEVQNCTKTGSHVHNGTACLPHNEQDGYGCYTSRRK